MKKLNLKVQNGAISVFVLIAMLFFMVTIVGIYTITSARAQSQTETIEAIQGQYYTEGMENTVYNDKIADNNATIPIYTKEQLYLVGSSKQVEIEGVLYTFARNANYELQNDIVINIDNDIVIPNSNLVDNNYYRIYYYYEGKFYDLSSESEEYDLEIGDYYFKIR